MLNRILSTPGKLECDRLDTCDLKRFSLSADDYPYVFGGIQANSPIWHFLSSGIQRLHKVFHCGKGFDTTTFSRPSSYYDNSQLREQHFKDGCSVYALKLLKWYLSIRQRSSTHSVILRMLSSRIWRTPIICQDTRPLASRTHLGCDEKEIAAVLE